MKCFPKQPRLENPHLLLMARREQRPCLIQSPQCLYPTWPTWCCACHGNSSIYGKGGHIKAHDFFSVWGCPRCHTWLDSSYSASNEERQDAFTQAIPRQIIEWALIEADPCSNTKDKAAVTWALGHLVERSYARCNNGLFVPAARQLEQSRYV